MRRVSALVFSLVTLALPTFAFAQSMSVMGNSSAARECYSASRLAASSGHGSTDGIADCTFALEQELLGVSDRAATYLNRGVLYAADSNFVQALADYNRAETINPSAGEVHLNKANLWFISEHYAQAVELYSKSLDLNIRKREVALYNRGMAYEKQGDYDLAIADYRAVLELFPEWERVNIRLQALLGKSAPS